MRNYPFYALCGQRIYSGGRKYMLCWFALLMRVIVYDNARVNHHVKNN